jgi:hypothetical protein
MTLCPVVHERRRAAPHPGVWGQDARHATLIGQDSHVSEEPKAVDLDRDRADHVLAYPTSVRVDAEIALEIMPPPKIRKTEPFLVAVDGGLVRIPYRIYNPEPPEALVSALDPLQRLLLSCMYTRHHDGHVRQRHNAHLLNSDRTFVVPFVVQLVGEYVLEILIDIQVGLINLNTAGSSERTRFGQFGAENPDFLARTISRIASYWGCYYRWNFPNLDDYPGMQLGLSLKSAAKEFSA